MIGSVLTALSLLATAPTWDAAAPPARPVAPMRVAWATADAPDAPAPPACPSTPLCNAWAVAPRAPMMVDGPGNASEWIELAMPAGMPHLREVRSETLMTVPRTTTLDVRNFSGNIAVQAWKRNDVRVIAEHGRRDHLMPQLENGTLSIAVLNRHGEPAFGDVTLLVPEWMALRLSSFESGITVDGVKAAIDAGSVRGDVVVRQSRGPLQLRSVEGGVRVFDARGHVQVASINNLIQLVRVIGLVDVESVNGNIEMSEVTSADVEASSVNGSVDFSGPFQPRGRYKLTSHRGNLRVGVPVGSAVDVSVANYNGAFESGFPVLTTPRARGRRFTFTLGGGGSSLELQSFEGLIKLMREDGMPLPPRPLPAPAPAPPVPAEEPR